MVGCWWTSGLLNSLDVWDEIWRAPEHHSMARCHHSTHCSCYKTKVFLGSDNMRKSNLCSLKALRILFECLRID